MNTELTIANFREIPANEQQVIQGGWGFVIAVALVAIEEVISDWDNFKNGLSGNPEEK